MLGCRLIVVCVGADIDCSYLKGNLVVTRGISLEVLFYFYFYLFFTGGESRCD